MKAIPREGAQAEVQGMFQIRAACTTAKSIRVIQNHNFPRRFHLRYNIKENTTIHPSTGNPMLYISKCWNSNITIKQNTPQGNKTRQGNQIF